MRARFGFTLTALAAATGLLAWGAFVTSIDAGLAVPDWPTSFSSYDPFNPWPEWWTFTPVLAEHGHRLAGALVGLLTLALAIWTWVADARPWVRRLALGALVLVTLQGILGGLRVVWVSIGLAVTHALVAQLFFALLASLALFTSGAWDRLPAAAADDRPGARTLRLAGPLATAAVYLQILFGALLRHPGTGIDGTLSLLHITWAVVTLAAVLVHARLVGRNLGDVPTGRSLARSLYVLVTVQVTLGFVAWFILLDEQGMIRPSNLQVVVNSLHLVIGAALFTTNALAVLVARRAAWNPSSSLSLSPAP
jgi:cytochrome c oxidase assembly protein subunit 15